MPSSHVLLGLAAALVGIPAVASRALQMPAPATSAVPDSSSVATQGEAPQSGRRAPVPFSVGERLHYDVHFGPIRAGSGSMEVRGIETVRGKEAYHTVFQVKGGIPFYRVHDVFESWFDTGTLASLKFVQDQDEGPKERERHYEIFPDQAVYRELVKGEGEMQPSVSNPLDDGSFLYFIRTVPLIVGRTYEFQRYFRPDRNPVTIRVLRKERVKVPAGTFEAIVIQPIIKTSGIFSENGHAEIWLSDDDRHIMLQMKSKLSFGSLNLYLTSYRGGTGVARSGGS
ncbi:MAG: DUF3108 domain-containing protein [Gemmatimonadaceae bacterium]